MTLVFMGLVSAMITERLSVAMGVRLLPLLLLVGRERSAVVLE
jgi:hypothetical protein